MSNLSLFDEDTFDKAFRRFFAPTTLEREIPHMKMRIDVTEGPEAYNVTADVPGVKKEDIHVRIDGNVVQIDAESKNEKETKGNGDKVLRSERYYGTISRTFSLAQDIDDARVDAKYADGVLKLVLPKKPATTGRRINVQ